MPVHAYRHCSALARHARCVSVAHKQPACLRNGHLPLTNPHSLTRNNIAAHECLVNAKGQQCAFKVVAGGRSVCSALQTCTCIKMQLNYLSSECRQWLTAEQVADRRRLAHAVLYIVHNTRVGQEPHLRCGKLRSANLGHTRLCAAKQRQRRASPV